MANLYFEVARVEQDLQNSNRTSQQTIFSSVAADQLAIKNQEDRWTEDIENSKTTGVKSHDAEDSFSGFMGVMECLLPVVVGGLMGGVGGLFIGAAIGSIFAGVCLGSKDVGNTLGFWLHKDAFTEITPEHEAAIQKISQDQSAVQELTGKVNNDLQIKFTSAQQASTSEEEILTSVLNDFKNAYSMTQRA